MNASDVRLPLIDTHAHLDAEEFDADRDAVIDRACEAGLVAMICPAIHADSSEAVVRLASQRPEAYATVGIQPNYASQAAPGDWDRIVRLAGEPKVVALGETGLDRYWDFAPIEIQRDYFARHLQLSRDRELPILIHCREAEADLLPMLRDAAAQGPIAGVLHSFSGDANFARECLDLGLYLSFSGAITYTNKKFGELREIASAVPADRLLIETDCPYLTPHPLRGKEKRNEPAHLRLTVQAVAALRGESPEATAQCTVDNARRLFRLPN